MEPITITSHDSNHLPLISPWVSIILFLSLTIFSHVVRSDYNNFCALGPGGTPSTIPGYLRIKFLGLFAIHNPYTPIPIPTHLNRTPYLNSKLSHREGARPKVRGIAPHRQLDQKISPDLFVKLRKAITDMGSRSPGLLNGTSCLEKHGPGLFAAAPVNRTRHCSGEVCHAHPSDGSMHLTLHPADAALVLSQAWGERHPLSSGGWLARFVPPGFVLIYAPRNEEEIEVVTRIVAAAVWWVAGVDVEGEGEGSGRLLTVTENKGEVEYDCQLPGLVRSMTRNV